MMSIRIQRLRARSLCSAAVMTLACTATAAAQEPPKIEKVTVTAQRRAQDAQDVPGSVSAISGKQVKDNNLKSTDDVAEHVPGVEIGMPSGKGNQPIITIRGVGLNDFNTNNSGPNGIYADDVYQSAPSAQTFQIFDLERIEVLKGPQGTLYGRNTSGGAINFISAKPTDEFYALGSASYASFDTYSVQGVLSGALGDDAGVRVAAVKNYSDGYMKNLETGEWETGADDIAGRILLQYDPSENFTLLFNLHGGRADTRPAEYRHVGTKRSPFDFGDADVCTVAEIQAGGCMDLWGYTGPSDFHEGRYNRRENLEIDSYGGYVRGDYEFGSVTLTSISAYETNDKFHPEDSDAEPFRLLEIDYGVNSKTFTQEFRLAGGGETYNWVTGLYYLHDDLKQDQTIYLFQDADVFFGPGGGDGLAQIGNSQSDQETTSYAIFGQTDFEIAARTRLTLGGRYTTETKSFHLDGITAFQNGGIDVYGPFVPLWTFDNEIDDSAVSGRVAIDHHVSEKVMAYASVSTGFKSGGFNGGFLSANPAEAAVQAEPVDSETVTAYEIGLKTESWSDRLRLNFAGFYYDYTDLQVFNLVPAVVPGGFPVNVLTNAESSTIQGVEIEALVKLTEDLTVGAEATYLDAAMDDFKILAGDPGEEDLSGNRLPLAPKFSLSTRANYSVSLDELGSLDFFGTLNYRSKVFFDIRNDPLLTQDGLWLANGRITYVSPDTHWELAVFGKNLTDEDYVDYGVNLTSIFGLLELNVGAPRTVGVELTYRN
jgi:iron complex outermembrane receptor protein